MEWRITRRRAIVAMELAIILPTLIIFFLGAIDYGRFIETDLAVTNAVRVGSARGTESPFTPETRDRWEKAIREAVLDEMSGLGRFDEEEMTLTITTTPNPDGTWAITTQVEYPFHTVVNWPMIPEERIVIKALTFQSNSP